MDVIETKVYCLIDNLHGTAYTKICVGKATYHPKTRTVIISVSRMPMPCKGLFITKVPARWERARRTS